MLNGILVCPVCAFVVKRIYFLIIWYFLELLVFKSNFWNVGFARSCWRFLYTSVELILMAKVIHFVMIFKSEFCGRKFSKSSIFFYT